MPSDPAPGAVADLVRVAAVSHRFAGEAVLERVDLAVGAGEIVTLIGPNGAGKTTLVRIVLGLAAPDEGRVWRRPGLRIGYMPQQLQVDDGMPLTVRRFLKLAGAVDEPALRGALDEVEAGHLLALPFQSLSGGETQRVLLARALLRRPDLMVLDEPVRSVDLGGQVELYDVIARLRRRHGCGVLMVSHDLHLVMAATDRVVCLNRHVCCAGQPETVSAHPEYLALFGPQAGRRLAVYTHQHDHRHDLHGAVVGDEHRHPPSAAGDDMQPKAAGGTP